MFFFVVVVFLLLFFLFFLFFCFFFVFVVVVVVFQTTLIFFLFIYFFFFFTKAPTKMAKVYRQRRGIILKTNISTNHEIDVIAKTCLYNVDRLNPLLYCKTGVYRGIEGYTLLL